MKLTDYVCSECCIADLQEQDTEAVLKRILGLLKQKGRIAREDELFAKLMERERIQSTAVGNGIAIPHCFADEIATLLIVVARAPGGIEFNSFDGKPTKVVLLLLGNKQNHSLHLKALARIARLVKNTRFIERVIAVATAAEMLQALAEEEGKL